MGRYVTLGARRATVRRRIASPGASGSRKLSSRSAAPLAVVFAAVLGAEAAGSSPTPRAPQSAPSRPDPKAPPAAAPKPAPAWQPIEAATFEEREAADPANRPA